eukprot:5009679-Prymnesium_polylepis.1
MPPHPRDGRTLLGHPGKAHTHHHDHIRRSSFLNVGETTLNNISPWEVGSQRGPRAASRSRPIFKGQAPLFVESGFGTDPKSQFRELD